MACHARIARWFSWSLLGLLAACTISTGGTKKPADDAGSTGDGRGTQSSASPGASRVVSAIEAGANHNCVLRETGQVSCWGNNESGQLGNGSFANSGKPVDVVNLTGAVEITLGKRHACARLDGGSVRCWGDNSRGQLGDTRGGPQQRSSRPVVVRGLDDAVELVAGDDHTCARRATGSVVCWGDNARGQLANDKRDWWPAPVAMQGLVDSTQLAAGSAHTCSLRETGRAICWGANDRGQLGDGGNDDRIRPGPVSGLGEVSNIVAAGERTCAIHGAGAVSCWGAGRVEHRRPKAIANLRGVELLAMGPAHTCVTGGDGIARCWGTNRDGRLGDGTTTQRDVPVRVNGPGQIQDLAAGRRHTCALVRGGEVHCWGDGHGGVLGSGDVEQEQGSVATWARDVDGAKAVATGAAHSCALLDSGEVRCWGNNDAGQLGDGTTKKRQQPTAVLGISNAIAIATGLNHSCAALRTGDVYCWGDNELGQVTGRPGKGSTKISRPTKVPGVTRANHVVGGAGHSCAIVDGGRVQCWGADAEGQLGDGPGSHGGKVAMISDAVQLSAGARHTCARRRAGQIMCWGENRWGQIGNGAGAATLKVPVESPAVVLRVDDATAVAAGDEHTCALRRSGAVACWGHNDDSQLGSGTTSNVWTTRVPARDVAGAKSLGSGVAHTCVGTDTATACWGRGSAGQLGSGHKQGQATARPGPRLRVSSISGGRDHTCALLRSGEVACWGSNDDGQLGDSEQNFSSTPRAVQGL